MKKTVLTLVLIFSVVSVCAASPLTDYSKGKVAIDYTYRPSLDMETAPEVSASTNVKEAEKEVNKINEILNSSDKNFDGKAKLDWGITAGLGNNWAFQYRGLKAEADGNTYQISHEEDRPTLAATESPAIHTRDISIGITPQVKSQEFNALYKLNNNFSAFAGLVEVTPSVKVSPSYSQFYQYSSDGVIREREETSAGGTLEFKGKDKHLGQIGIIGTANVADKTNVYGIAAVGNDYRNLIAGISYEIDKNLEFDVNYRHTKFENLSFASGFYNYSESGSDEPGLMQNGRSNQAFAGEFKSDVTVKGWGFGLTYKF